jgi:hypothetical protein
VSFWRVSGLGVPWLRGLVGVALLSTLAQAQPEAAGSAPAPDAALSIWYRSSEGCPEGSVFVARLAELGRRATLARVGDRVDFVVTVAGAPNASSGRLERQTARGTVAIRELDAPRCEEVTEALALSLDIALDPANIAPSSAPGPGPSSGSAPSSGNLAAASAPGAASVAPPAAVDRAPDREDPPGEPARRGALALGAQGSLMKGIAPRWAAGGALFAELRARDAIALAARFSLAAAFADATRAAIDVDVLWLAGRLEGCAFELRSGPLSLQPCAALELGLVRAGSSGDGGQRDTGVWTAALASMRASLELDERFALEAQAGATLPFVRYAVGSSLGGDLFRTEAVIPTLGLGGRWSP